MHPLNATPTFVKHEYYLLESRHEILVIEAVLLHSEHQNQLRSNSRCKCFHHCRVLAEMFQKFSLILIGKHNHDGPDL